MDIIKLKNANLEIKNRGILLQIPEFSISESEIVFFSGMNGVGKSTFFKTLINFSGIPGVKYSFLSGSNINLDGINPYTNEKVIYVSQDEYLSIPYQKVKDVLKEGFAYNKCNKNQAMDAWIDKYKPFSIEELKSGFLNQRIGSLSGGQTKFLKIIQALERCDSSSVRLIILDEPINHLDVRHIATLSNLILKIKAEHPLMSILISSHCHIFPIVNKAYTITDSRIIQTKYSSYNCIGGTDSEGFYK